MIKNYINKNVIIGKITSLVVTFIVISLIIIVISPVYKVLFFVFLLFVTIRFIGIYRGYILVDDKDIELHRNFKVNKFNIDDVDYIDYKTFDNAGNSLTIYRIYFQVHRKKYYFDEYISLELYDYITSRISTKFDINDLREKIIDEHKSFIGSAVLYGIILIVAVSIFVYYNYLTP